MTADLDTRMRAAGDSLVRATERLSPAPPPPRSLRPLTTVVAGLVAAVALVAGTVALWSSGENERENDTATAPAAGTVPRLIPDAVPDAVRPVGVTELSPDVATVSTQSFSVYGDPSASDPFAAGDLGIVTASFPLQTDDGWGDSITVRGHEGVVADLLPGATAVLWQEADTLTVGLASRSLDPDQLAAIADGLEIDPEARTVDLGPLPEDLPGPLEPVVAADVGTVSIGVHALGIQGFGLPLGASTAGHVESYQPVDYDSFSSATVAMFTGDARDVALARWLGGAGTPTEVRGRQGWSGSSAVPGFDDGEGIVPGSQGPVSAVVWEEAPGVVAVVHTFGPSENEARAMAESLRPAADDEWARLVRLGASGDRFRPVDEQLRSQDRFDGAGIRSPDDAVNGAEGVYGDAGVWTTWLEGDGGLCGAVAEAGEAAEVDDGYLVDTSETCDPDGGPATVVEDDTGRPVLVIGVMPAEAVGRVADGGDVEEVQTITGPDDAPAYYVMVVADGAVPDTITFVAADGTDLDTVTVDH